MLSVVLDALAGVASEGRSLSLANRDVRSKKKGAHMVQLTSNKKRKDARRFYESLGFESSHEGFKLHL